MISLRQSLSIADSNYLAAAVACSNYVVAVDMTSLQQPLLAIAGGTFAAVAMMSLQQSLSIADSSYVAAAIACSNHVAAAAMTSRQQSLSAIAGSHFAAVDMIVLCGNRCPSRTAAT